jgi:hypothetical protein
VARLVGKLLLMRSMIEAFTCLQSHERKSDVLGKLIFGLIFFGVFGFLMSFILPLVACSIMSFIGLLFFMIMPDDGMGPE